MGLFDIFKTGSNSGAQQELSSRLELKLRDLLTDAAPPELIKVACISGLLARVAYADMKIEASELEGIEEALIHWARLSQKEASAVATIAVDEMVDLAGLQNHKYCQALNDHMDKEQRYNLLKSLFNIAARDGLVESVEAEEIRLITKGLKLEHKHFVSAQVTVREFLASLK